MINFIVSHKIAVGIIAVLVAVLAWIGLSSSGSSSSSLLTTENVNDSGPDQELITKLIALRAVKLDASLFSDPGFQSLEDYSTSINSEPVGRPNPFAPLGNIVIPSVGAQGAPASAVPSGKK